MSVSSAPDMAPSEILGLLAATTIPGSIASELIDGAAPLWLHSAPSAVLARDLALCHPGLAPHEVRAAAYSMDQGKYRITVVARDRVGFLADSAAVMAAARASIVSASAVTWPNGVALHALTVSAPHLGEDEWTTIGTQLRAAAAGAFLSVGFTPAGSADVERTPTPTGQCLLTVVAPDQVGLLWGICRWLADHDVSIEAAHVHGTAGLALDRFVVSREIDEQSLQAFLSGA